MGKMKYLTKAKKGCERISETPTYEREKRKKLSVENLKDGGAATHPEKSGAYSQSGAKVFQGDAIKGLTARTWKLGEKKAYEHSLWISRSPREGQRYWNILRTPRQLRHRLKARRLHLTVLKAEEGREKSALAEIEMGETRKREFQTKGANAPRIQN